MAHDRRADFFNTIVEFELAIAFAADLTGREGLEHASRRLPASSYFLLRQLERRLLMM